MDGLHDIDAELDTTKRESSEGIVLVLGKTVRFIKMFYNYY